MCLAVPGKIISIDRSIPEMTMAKVDFGGILKNICIEWVDVKQGDYSPRSRRDRYICCR